MADPLSFMYEAHWIQWKDGGYRLFSIAVDERLPLCPDDGPKYPGRPWYRHCYACGLDAGGQHTKTCPWVHWLDLADYTLGENRPLQPVQQFTLRNW